MSAANQLTTVHLRGAGGVVWEFELPLEPVYVQQLKTGALLPADPESAAALAAAGIERRTTVSQEPTRQQKRLARQKAAAKVDPDA